MWKVNIYIIRLNSEFCIGKFSRNTVYGYFRHNFGSRELPMNCNKVIGKILRVASSIEGYGERDNILDISYRIFNLGFNKN